MNDTRLFARFLSDGVQAIAYEMHMEADQDVAMILPLPVDPQYRENGLRFLDLQGFPKLFSKLDLLFPQPRSAIAAESAPFSVGPGTGNKLQVQEIGSFEASYVPSIADFPRLDQRFRLPSGVWEKLPQYQEFGFAVFKLRSGSRKIHPMAFAFATSMKQELFFPTVHIHDGQVHSKEHFDHVLYAQSWPGAAIQSRGWEESIGVAANLDSKQAKGLFWPDGHVYRKILQGKLPNLDQLVTFRRAM